MMDILQAIWSTTLGTINDVLPIAVIIFGFQFIVLRQKPANLGEILFGFGWVLVGLSLFLLGVDWCLFPLGRLMASQLTAPAFIYEGQAALEMAAGVTFQEESDWGYYRDGVFGPGCD